MEIYCDLYNNGCAVGSYDRTTVAATRGYDCATAYPLHEASNSQSKSEGLFGWLPGSGIMHKVIEKTKVEIRR